MPVNSLSETTKGVARTKLSLSLRRNNATNPINANQKPGDLKDSSYKGSNDNKENKPVKRPITGTYLNTLNAAKKLKPLTETSKPKGMFIYNMY